MNRPQRRTLVVATLVVALAAGALIVAFASPWASHASTGAGPSAPVTYLNLTIAFDPSMGMASFTTPNLTMVAHSQVVVTITNHDPTTGNLYNSWDRNVIGTVGGTETVNTGTGSYSATSLPMGSVSHTFTVVDALYNFSVPIPPAPSAGTPVVVVFQLSMGSAENTTWACMCDCQGGHMTTGMYGRLSISD